MSGETVTMIAATEARTAAEREEGDIVAKLKAAMGATNHHWMCTDPAQQFRAAVAGVMLHYGKGSEEYEALQWESAQLGKLNAMIVAATAGLEVSVPEFDDSRTPIGLLKLWHEVTSGQDKRSR